MLSRASIYQPARTRKLALCALGVIALDQWTKHLLLAALGMQAGAEQVVTSFFKLVVVWNYGVSFGMAAMPGTLVPVALTAFALVVSAALWVLAHKSTDAFERICYMVVVGGALGNAIDRMRYGAVADFLYFHIGALGWPAFNVADASIFCGVAALVIRGVWPARGA